MLVERRARLTFAVVTTALAIDCAAPKPPPQPAVTRTIRFWGLPEGPGCPPKPLRLDEANRFGFSVRQALEQLSAGEQRFALGEDRGGFLESLGLRPGIPSTDRLTLRFVPAAAEQYVDCPDGHDSNEIGVLGTVTAKLSQGLTLSGKSRLEIDGSIEGRSLKGALTGWVSSARAGCQLVWQLSPEGVMSSALLHGDKADARWNPIQPTSL